MGLTFPAKEKRKRGRTGNGRGKGKKYQSAVKFTKHFKRAQKSTQARARPNWGVVEVLGTAQNQIMRISKNIRRCTE